MATLAKSVIQQAGKLVQDANLERWDSSDLLDWLNEGVVMVASAKRNVNTTQISVGLASGARQTLPANVLRVVSFVRNNTANAKSVVQLADRSFLDRMAPSWQAAEQAEAVTDVCYDREDLRSFYVSPPNNGNGSLLVDVVQLPARMTSIDNTVPVPDEYVPMLVNYVFGRCLQAETEEQARSRGDKLHDTFLRWLGIIDERQEDSDPNEKEDGSGGTE